MDKDSSSVKCCPHFIGGALQGLNWPQSISYVIQKCPFGFSYWPLSDLQDINDFISMPTIIWEGAFQSPKHPHLKPHALFKHATYSNLKTKATSINHVGMHPHNK